MRPIVGITTDLQTVIFGAWEEESALVPADYVRAVERAGGRPVLIPPSGEGIEETLDLLDALVLSGGSDLDPATYGHDPHPETNGVVRSATAPSWRSCTRRSSATCPCWPSAAGARC